jgi:hypothetical protein
MSAALVTDFRRDRPFTYSSIHTYYAGKTRTRRGAPLFENHTFGSLNDLADFLRPGLPTEIWKDAWKETIAAADEKKKNAVWLFREWALANIFLFGAQQMSGAGDTVTILEGNVRKKPDIAKSRFSSVGSTDLTSDIDVTIQGPQSHHVIAILEDICYALTDKGIPIRLMDIEFYVDYRLSDRLFVNIHKFTPAQREELLKWGYVSYFRSIHRTDASPLAKKIGAMFVGRAGGTRALDAILADAAATVAGELGGAWKLDREKAYAYYDAFESRLASVHWNGNASNNTKMEAALAADLFFLLTKAQLHQPENYILPSTIVDIVVIQQAGDSAFDPAAVLSEKPRINLNARVSIDTFGLLASALEQLGYLEFYMPSPAEKCTPTAAKYYLRLLRALENSRALESSHPNTAKIGARKASERCGSDIDIPQSISALETAKMAGGTRRRRRGSGKRRTRRRA